MYKHENQKPDTHILSKCIFFFLALPCGPTLDVITKRAVSQYTVTADGITAAYVCNDGLHWTDGVVVKYDVCDNGTWVQQDNDTTAWDTGCQGQ